MIYLDTSAAIALFLPEVKTENVKEWFATCLDPIVSADWIVTEFASALSLKERRGDLTAKAARAVWAEFEVFRGSGLRLVPVSREAYLEAAQKARDARSRLRAGDSLHLAVALEAGATSMASLDDVLGANARKHGLATINF